MAPSPYGSIEASDPEKGQPSGFEGNEDAENRDERDFNLSDSYYLKDHSGDGRAKFLRALLPILIAGAIVGGLGYFFFRDFNHLYPGSGGSGGEESDAAAGSSSYDSSPVSVEDDAPAPATESSTEDAFQPTAGHSSGSSCEAHEKCAALGLTGICCPTMDGVMLGCC